LKTERLRIDKAILRENNSAGGNTVSDFKLYYRAIAIKAAWYWHKNRYKVQRNRIEVLDKNPHSYVHLIFDKITKIYTGE
jgi:hypothetical protein